MKRKRIVFFLLQILPIILWAVLFWATYQNYKYERYLLGGLSVVLEIRLATIFYLPIIFTVVNFFFVADRKHFLKLNIVFTTFQLCGIQLFGFLYGNYIRDDIEGRGWTLIQCIFSVLYLGAISGICYVIKRAMETRKERGNNTQGQGDGSVIQNE